MGLDRWWAKAVLLAVACLLAYAPALTQPFIEDDYHLIGLSERVGAADQWRSLAGNPAVLGRATSFWWLHLQHHLFGMNAAGYYAASLGLHLLVTWLIWGLGAWEFIGWRAGFWAALFFAVYEGHQEAVMWISASNELFVCLFGLAGLECLRRSLKHGRTAMIWYLLSLASFCFALLSKESGVSWCALYALVLLAGGAGRQWQRVIPFFVLAAVMMAYLFAASAGSFRFSDGSFALSAPFWKTLARSFARLHWFWGPLAVIAVLARRTPETRRLAWMGLAWAAIALLPYAFLLYMPHVASRHTYPASAGLALVVAAGAIAMLESRPQPALSVVLAGAILIHNVGYLWLVKRPQFLERAAPTEQLLEYVRTHPGPVWVRCFPRPRVIAEEALRLKARVSPGEVLWSKKDADRLRLTSGFCFQGFDGPVTPAE